MIDPKDLPEKDDDWVATMVTDPILKQQARRRRRFYAVLAISCVIAVLVGAMIGWNL
jgi:F0F1-type ATP synthase assembly protein I